MDNHPQIPMSSPDITDAERQAVADVLQTTNLSMGSRTVAFETAIQEYSGIKHAISVKHIICSSSRFIYKLPKA